MKLKNYAYRCLAVVCAIVAVACVDEEFSFDKVSTEVSIFDGETILPLGSLEKQTLGDLLGSDTELPEGIVKKEDGSYEFFYELETTSVSADEFELPTSFDIAASASSFNIDLPSLDFSTYGAGVKETFGLDLPLGESFKTLLQNVGAGTTEFEITSFMFNLIPEEQRQFAKELSEEVEIDEIKFDLPEQIKSLNRVIFDSPVEGHDGAPFGVHLDLKGFAGINGGGHFHFILKSKADLIVKNSANQKVTPTEDGDYNVYTIESDIEAEAESIGFDIYIAAIDSEPTQDRSVVIDPSMVFDIDFELNAKAGVLKLDGNGGILMPEVTIESNFALADAEVVFDSSVDLFNFEFGGEGAEGFNIEIDQLPEQIKSIDRVELTDDSKIVLYAKNLDWLGDAVSLDLEMPACLRIKESEGYTYNTETNILSTTVGAIGKSLNILFDAIDLSEVTSEGGPIVIEFSPSGRVHFTNENPMSINDFLPKEGSNIEVEVGIGESSMGFESVTAQVDFKEPIEEKIELEGLSGELPVEIGGSGLSPVIKLTISNPLTIDANIVATLLPYVGEEAQDSKKIDFKATIAGAKKSETTGEVEATTTTIVLAKASRSDEFPAEEGYTFVACDIDNLISTPMPDYIMLSAEFGLPEEPITLHLGDVENLEFAYGASISLPFAFDNQLSITFEDTIDVMDEKGNSPLAEVAEIEDLQVGDLALIAEIETTLPLELAVTTTLYDKDGNELPTKIGFADEGNIIKGSKDGETAEKSTLRLQFALANENGSLAELADIASVGLKIEAASAAEEGVVALKEEQYIAAVLKLAIDGGITVDLSKLNDK
ncbi:MAG: hypothetical protein IKW47_03075 [Alistipes sp.]|nr:hypothetical protein [Alistipes sp.]